MFGSSSFAYKNIRRKADARAYPTRLEFGLKGGLVAPTALNNGEQIELLLGRIAVPYCRASTTSIACRPPSGRWPSIW